MLDQLIFYGAGFTHLALRCIAAVESHERIGQLVIIFPLDILVIDILRYGVVDIEKGNRIFGNAKADIFAQGTVDIHLTGYRNSSGAETAVDIARFKTKLRRECRPALICKCNIFSGTLVSLCPVKKGKFKLSHLGIEVSIIFAFAHFLCHISTDIRNARIIFMFLKGNQKIQLRVFLDLHTKLIETLDRSIAGKEVLRTRAKGDDF